MGVAVLQMTSNVTQRYAVSPLLPGANVTIELVRSVSLIYLNISLPTTSYSSFLFASCLPRNEL